jgi:hypothetical protein
MIGLQSQRGEGEEAMSNTFRSPYKHMFDGSVHLRSGEEIMIPVGEVQPLPAGNMGHEIESVMWSNGTLIMLPLQPLMRDETNGCHDLEGETI